MIYGNEPRIRLPAHAGGDRGYGDHATTGRELPNGRCETRQAPAPRGPTMPRLRVPAKLGGVYNAAVRGAREMAEEA